ncbi:MAG: T9SS type A sorting domain-containing protein [Bacteroidota bacterium]
MYPNPSGNLLTIQLGSESENYQVHITNIFGEQVLSSVHAKTIDISTLSKGMYFINVYQGCKMITTKFIKK